MDGALSGPEELPPCPVCGRHALLEVCDPAGLALCPRCGALLRWFGRRFAPSASVARIRLDTLLTQLGGDSLDRVEFIMELEEEFGAPIPEDVLERLTTVEDVIRYLECSRKEDAA
jgi:acyl carrier protein